MCGIIGLLVKRDNLRSQLGKLAIPMIDCMGTRGPDSAGLAVYHEPLEESQRRFALHCDVPGFDWNALQEALHSDPDESSIEIIDNHATIVSSLPVEKFRERLVTTAPDVHLISVGRAIEMFKDEGLPADIAARYEFSNVTGSHVIAHTRMATESAISPAHAHPYTAGEDFCLVHNGSLSNPYSIRRKLENRGIAFETDNDTEAGCRYLEWRMREGDTLEQAIENSFSELDGFFTFLMATADRMVLVRDAFACKPAVAAETDDYVAVSSEFRALAHLPDIQSANVFEPAPEQIYSWTV